MNMHTQFYARKCWDGTLLPLPPGENPNESLKCQSAAEAVVTIVRPRGRGLALRPMVQLEFAAHCASSRGELSRLHYAA
jgi:hypothetical protein